MSSILKLDRPTIINQMKWRWELASAAPDLPPYGPGYRSILVGADLAGNSELNPNQKRTVALDSSFDPVEGYSHYHLLLAVNPDLLEMAEVSAPSLLLPGHGRRRPSLHLRGLRKGDLATLGWFMSVHLVD